VWRYFFSVAAIDLVDQHGRILLGDLQKRRHQGEPPSAPSLRLHQARNRMPTLVALSRHCAGGSMFATGAESAIRAG
jgi:hypothetical protein